MLGLGSKPLSATLWSLNEGRGFHLLTRTCNQCKRIPCFRPNKLVSRCWLTHSKIRRMLNKICLDRRVIPYLFFSKLSLSTCAGYEPTSNSFRQQREFSSGFWNLGY
uniref:Uncharacterized protein n=1 Tax=Kalanchoe fedtschenkoi TaxID=63787 RepID=A0A7N0RAR5_KALFE